MFIAQVLVGPSKQLKQIIQIQHKLLRIPTGECYVRKVRKVRNKPVPWLNSEIKKEMLNRDWLKKKAIKSGSQNDWSTFKKARNAVNYSIRCAKSEYYYYKLNERMQVIKRPHGRFLTVLMI